MKITLEISDTLLEEVRKLAMRERTTLHVFVEQGLRRIIIERQRKRGYKLRKASFKGRGLRPGVATVNFDKLRDLAYEGRGS
jgi:mRNA-degrading endonuclease RelE of RelBE toxin-antitoxin system